MNKQMTKIATMVVLAIGMMASSMTAQNKEGGFAPVGIYSGVESDTGTRVALTDTCHGDTFVLSSHGEWESYHLTGSVSYSRAQFVPGSFIVTGGSWSLMVIRDNQYAGTLYGTIRSGNLTTVMNNVGEQISKRVQVELSLNGGFGAFAGPAGIGAAGVCDMSTDIRSGETNGVARFNF